VKSSSVQPRRLSGTNWPRDQATICIGRDSSPYHVLFLGRRVTMTARLCWPETVNSWPFATLRELCIMASDQIEICFTANHVSIRGRARPQW
jgi:hypothetical protein